MCGDPITHIFGVGPVLVPVPAGRRPAMAVWPGNATAREWQATCLPHLRTGPCIPPASPTEVGQAFCLHSSAGASKGKK